MLCLGGLPIDVRMFIKGHVDGVFNVGVLKQFSIKKLKVNNNQEELNGEK